MGGSVLDFISTPITATLINITIERYSSSSKPSANHHHLILIKMVIKWSSNHHLSKTGTAMTATCTKWLESLMTLMPTAGDLFVMDGVHGVWAWWCSWWFFLNLCLRIGEVVTAKYNFEDDDRLPHDRRLRNAQNFSVLHFRFDVPLLVILIITICTQDYLDLPPWQELANCSYVLTADDLGVPFQCCWCFPRNDSADGIPWQDGANSPRSWREQKGRRCIFRSPGGILPLRCCLSFIFVTFIFVTKYKYQKMKMRVSRGGILPF